MLITLKVKLEQQTFNNITFDGKDDMTKRAMLLAIVEPQDIAVADQIIKCIDKTVKVNYEVLRQLQRIKVCTLSAFRSSRISNDIRALLRRRRLS